MALIIVLLVLVLIAVFQGSDRPTGEIDPALGCILWALMPFMIVAFLFLMMMLVDPH